MNYLIWSTKYDVHSDNNCWLRLVGKNKIVFFIFFK